MTSGDVLLCDLNPVAGREQGGVRPVVAVSHPRYAAVPGLFTAVPLTTQPRSAGSCICSSSECNSRSSNRPRWLPWV
jgi:mRNA-degrading endonuclease toxin of MazEF toxin-antitoxin module